ncbi:MAG: efflux RND transporter periplasmic adaptor subunit [Candidatus Krumholzibacteriota bacterium]|nr:efflux RND transporter periplasmic adaptor subunit [Candidatus Krumholzibacteriota bacterium]
MKKWLTIAIIGLVAVLLVFRLTLLLVKGGGGGGSGSQRPAVAVETAPVLFGPIKEIRRFTGTIFPYNQYIVAPKVSGRLTEITKRIGDPVEEGELIARIGDAEYQQAVREAEANMKIAEASLSEARSQLDLARQGWERAESLEKKGMVTSAELDAALSEYDARKARFQLAQAQVEQRRAALESSRIRLGYTRLTASGPGFIGERFVDEGALLVPNAAVVLVVGIDLVIVRTMITERDYGHIERGQAGDVLVDAFPKKRFSGTVARVAPMMRESSRMAELEMEIDNGSHMLKPGMFARIEVVTSERDSTQIVPSSAVVERGEDTVTFVVPYGEDVARCVKVTIGIVTPDFTEIIEPVINGRVVTLGQHLLEDGSPVTLQEKESGAADTPDAEKGEKDIR